MSHEAADPAHGQEGLQLSAADMVWWSNVFKTLGDPVRLHLLIHLAAQGEPKSRCTTFATQGWRSPP